MSVTLLCLLPTKSNYTTRSIKMHVNLKVHGVWHVIEHDDDVEESKNLMTLTAIYQAVLEDVLLILAEKNSSKNVWKTLQKMHISVE